MYVHVLNAYLKLFLLCAFYQIVAADFEAKGADIHLQSLLLHSRKSAVLFPRTVAYFCL